MTAVVPQWVEVVDASEGWVDFDDPQGRAVMTWETARNLHTRAANTDHGWTTHLGRRFDRDVLAAVVHVIDQQPTCTLVARVECGAPAIPTSQPPRCVAHERY